MILIFITEIPVIPYYYNISHNIDHIIEDPYNKINLIKVLKEEILLKLFKKTEVNSWFCEITLIKKREPHKLDFLKLKQYTDLFIHEPLLQKIYYAILFLKNGLKIKTTRRELLTDILKAIRSADEEDTNVYEAMKQ